MARHARMGAAGPRHEWVRAPKHQPGARERIDVSPPRCDCERDARLEQDPSRRRAAASRERADCRHLGRAREGRARRLESQESMSNPADPKPPDEGGPLGLYGVLSTVVDVRRDEVRAMLMSAAFF